MINNCCNCCNKRIKWLKCSQNLPECNEWVIVHYKLFGKSYMNVAKFAQYKDIYDGLKQEWCIYPPLCDSINPIAILRNEDVLYWHRIAEAPEE